MPGFGDLVKKAFYLGVGVASYAGEKAGHTIKDLQEQTQLVVNELVARGEMTAEEAQRLVNDMVNRAQETVSASDGSLAEPRRIEILDDEPSPAQPSPDPADILRQEVAALHAELEALKRKAGNG
jgi:polyhydroxyalkanoate synthesis regulator phasin